MNNRRALLTAAACLLLAGCSDRTEREAQMPKEPASATAKISDASAKFRTGNGTKQAFSQPFDGMDDHETDRFVRGKSFFSVPWVEAPSATSARDGLGPLFSANTCLHCHPRNGAGVAVAEDGKMNRSLVFRLSVPENLNADIVLKTGFTPEPVYGGQLSMNGNGNVVYEGYPEVSYREQEGSYPDGERYSLRIPTYAISGLQYGPLDPEANIAPHIAPALVGLGLIERIPTEAILQYEDAEDRDKDGISGRANWVHDTLSGTKALGRFTWKAAASSVLNQTANAASNDMGLTSPLYPEENCTPSQTACNEAPKGRHAFDLPQSRLEAITYYLTHLKIPRPRPFEQKAEAEELFERLACSKCHVPGYTTEEGVPIAPFSDFLLHDMGEALSDGHTVFSAGPREFRTPPLWGIGLYAKVSGEANYLHDGRARSAEEAILWHGGEAEASKKAFQALSKEARRLLLHYLETI